jgi:hypothetical protein
VRVIVCRVTVTLMIVACISYLDLYCYLFAIWLDADRVDECIVVPSPVS